MTLEQTYKDGNQATGLSSDEIKKVLQWFFQTYLPYVTLDLGESITFNNCGKWYAQYRKPTELPDVNKPGAWRKIQGRYRTVFSPASKGQYYKFDRTNE